MINVTEQEFSYVIFKIYYFIYFLIHLLATFQKF